MFLIRLWHYLKGYVIIIVSGIFAERFVNICTRRQILLWDMERLDVNSLRMKISIRGFKACHTAARKSRCRIRIAAKKGFPFILNRYRKRKGFYIGLAAFALLIYFMTSIIWFVEISGNSEVKTETLINQINEMGIYRGIAKRLVNPKILADTLMLKNSELSWAGVEIKGTGLYITVKEGIEPPAVIPLDEPCHIVARTDGIIVSVQAKNGLEVVKKGDTVKKGQVLISGNIESIHPEFGSMQVHALGEVIARTWYEIKREVPEKQTIKRRTGREYNKYSVYFLDFIIPLPSKDNPYQLYEIGVFDKTPVIGENLRLPFGLTIQRFYEIEQEERVLSSEQARALAQNAVISELKEKIPEDAEIADEQLRFVAENGKEYVIITVECTEDIAVKQQIGGN